MVDRDNEHLFAYERFDEETKYLITCNFSKEIVDFSYDGLFDSELILSNYNDTQNDYDSIVLRAYESVIYKIA